MLSSRFSIAISRAPPTRSRVSFGSLTLSKETIPLEPQFCVFFFCFPSVLVPHLVFALPSGECPWLVDGSSDPKQAVPEPQSNYTLHNCRNNLITHLAPCRSHTHTLFRPPDAVGPRQGVRRGRFLRAERWERHPSQRRNLRRKIPGSFLAGRCGVGEGGGGGEARDIRGSDGAHDGGEVKTAQE